MRFPSLCNPILSDAIMTVLISTPIQIFVAWRIRVISRSIWVALSICILAVISFGKFMIYKSLLEARPLIRHSWWSVAGHQDRAD